MRRRSSFSSLLLPLLLSAPAALAQTAGSVGIGTATPHPAAALDISSSGKGLLIPRLDSAQRAAIPSPPTGLMVFQTDGRQGFWYYGGGQWLYLPDKTRTGDNLGNHRATQNLDLGAHQLVGNGGTSGLAIDSTGRVGVGTIAPRTPLHVLSRTYDVATFTTNLGAGPHLLLERDSSRAVIDYIGLDTGNGEREGALELRGNTSVQISGDGDVSRPDLTVLANGNVGIGTNFPQHKLHVEGLLYTEGIRFPDNSLQTKAATGDNLGNHRATQNLNLRRNLLTGGGGGLALDSVGLATATVQTQPLLRLVRPTTTNVKWPNQLQIGLGSYGTAAESQTRADFTLSDGGTNTPDRTVLSLLANGNVGIGTTGPQKPLHVTSGNYDLATLESSNVGPHLNLVKTGAGQATIDYIGTGVTNSYRDGALELRGSSAVHLSADGDTSPELAVRANGNVGIGTPDPQQKLHVTGQVYSSAGGFRFPDNSVQTTAAAADNLGNHRATQNLNLRRNLLTGGGAAGLAIDSVGRATATVQTQPVLRVVRPITDGSKWPNELQIGLGSYGTGANSQTRADFRLIDGYTNTPDRTVMTLLGNGNVGVGTTSPQNPLHVAASGYDAATFEAATAGPHLNLVRTGSTGQATIDYIGTNTGNGTREGALELRGNTSVQISGNNDATPELTVRADGKVGVGTSDPQATLDVNGSVRLGPQGTPMRNVQSGILTVGSNSNNLGLAGIVFPHAFTTTPLVLVTVTAQDGTSVWDTFTASVRTVSPTVAYINIQRTDTNSGGWGQNVRLTWMAWEP